MNKLIIYVKDEKQERNIRQKHPDLDAEFLSMGNQTELHDMMPMVCIDKDGQERCEIGEDYIERFKRL